MEQAELSRLLRQAELTPLLPHSRDFQRARRVWNADIDRRPAAIVRCRTASEVARAVSCCFASGVDCTVRGGGHNVAGSAVSDGAVLIDLAGMAEVELLEGGEVAVGGGATWAAVDAVTGAAGCAVPAGLISHTGVGGLTLGGGYVRHGRGLCETRASGIPTPGRVARSHVVPRVRAVKRCLESGVLFGLCR